MLAQAAEPTVERAQARYVPWSGYWWPHREGRMLDALAKYDRISGHEAALWERQQHPPGPNVPQWHGYCHAWAASAVMESEPVRPVTVASLGRDPIRLGIGDQKALLAACHTEDAANSYGDRFGDGDGSEDPQDLRPEVLWKLLNLYVKQQGVPLVLDVEPKREVWNYPVYAYELSYRPMGDAGVYQAELTLLMADDAVAADYVGVQVYRKNYQFTFKLRSGAVAMGSGRWIGPSRDNHPDFAWYPYVAQAENPQVVYNEVQRILKVERPSPGELRVESRESRVQPPAPRPAPQPQPAPQLQPQPQPPSPQPQPQPPAPRPSPSILPASTVVLSPHELAAVIADKSSSFALDATVDRFDGGHYRPGETFSVRAASARAGYLYLLHIDSQGTLSLLYPLPGQDNRVKAGASFVIPKPRDRFAFRATEPPGTNRVKVLVTSRPLILSGLAGVSSVQQGQQQQTARQGFRWHPAEALQMQVLLRLYHEQQPLPAEQLAGVDPGKLLGPFAQDEVAFYVEPAGNGK